MPRSRALAISMTHYGALAWQKMGMREHTQHILLYADTQLHISGRGQSTIREIRKFNIEHTSIKKSDLFDGGSENVKPIPVSF